MEKDCGLWVNILSHKLKKRMNENLQDLGISGLQFRAMHFILAKSAEGAVFQRDIERALGLSRSTATGVLQLMEKDGLIRRESVASDARLKRLVPTERAFALNEQLTGYLERTEDALTQGLTDAQVAAFRQTLERMSANLDSAGR